MHVNKCISIYLSIHLSIYTDRPPYIYLYTQISCHLGRPTILGCEHLHHLGLGLLRLEAVQLAAGVGNHAVIGVGLLERRFGRDISPLFHHHLEGYSSVSLVDSKWNRDRKPRRSQCRPPRAPFARRYQSPSSPPPAKQRMVREALRSTPTQQPTIPWSSLLQLSPRQCHTLQLSNRVRLPGTIL